MPLGVGDPAPLFSGDDVLTSQPFSLTDHQGKVVLVAFSGLSYCEPCQFEAPVLQELSEEYGAGVQFVMVELEAPEKYPDVPALVEKFGITFPVIIDASPEGAWDPIMQAYAAPDPYFPIPMLFVINKEVTICATHLGANTSDSTGALKAEIAQMLEGCGAPPPYTLSGLSPGEWVAAVQILFGVVQDGGGFAIPGGHIPPWSPLRRSAQTRSVLAALAVHQLAEGIADRRHSLAVRKAALEAADSALAMLAERTRLEETSDRSSVPPQGLTGSDD